MRRHLVARIVISGGIAGATVLLPELPSFAGTYVGSGNGSVSDGTITATAGSTSSGTTGADDPTSGGSGGSSTPPQCLLVPLPPADQAALGSGGPTPGEWYAISCGGTVVVQSTGVYWIPNGQAPNLAPSVPALLQQAIGQAALVHPTIVLNPPGDQVVNLASWLAISPGGWSAVVASASAGAVTATVTAVPESVIWNLGDGDSVTCQGPGVLYDPSKPAGAQSTYCSYLWPQSSANAPGGVFDVTATIEYQVTTTVIGAPDPTPSLGIYAGPTKHIDVAVSEIEALGTSS